MVVIEQVEYFNGVYDVTRKVCRSELIPGLYYVYDEYEDGSQERVLSKDKKISMSLLDAAMLLEEVRQ